MRLRVRIQIRPTSPASTGSPSSSRSAIVKPRIGLPDRALPDLARGRVERRQADLGHPVPLDDREPGRRPRTRSAARSRPCRRRRGRAAARRSRCGCRSWSWISAESAAGIIASTVGWCSRSSGSSSWASCCGRPRPCRRPRASRAPRGTSRCGTCEEPGRKTSPASSSKAAAALAIIQRERLAGVGDALGGAGAARGEEDHGRARDPAASASDSGSASSSVRKSWRQSASRPVRILVPGRERLRVAVGDRPELQAAGALARGDVLGPLDMSEQRPGAAHLQRVVDLAGGVAVVQRRRHQPGPEAGEVVDDEVDRFGISEARRSPGSSPSAR